MGKRYEEKLRALKAVAAGNKPIEAIRPPRHWFAEKRVNDGDVYYLVSGEKMSEEQYEQWVRNNVREEDDHLVLFIEVMYGDEEDEEKSVSHLEIHQEPITEPLAEREPAEEKIIKKEIKPAVKSVIEPQLRPYSEHIAFNEFMNEQLFL